MNADSTTIAPPARHRRWRRAILWLVGGLVVLWIVGLLSATWDLRQAQEAVRRRGHPATYEEMVARLHAEVPSQTGVELLRRATAENERLGRPGDSFQLAGGSLDFADQKPAPDVFDDLLQRSNSVLPLIEEAVALPPGPFSNREAAMRTGQDYEDVHQIRSLIRLMTLPLKAAALRGDHEATTHHLVTCLRLTEQLAAEELVIPQLIRIALLGVATKNVQMVLPRLILNEKGFKTLDSQLASIEANLKFQDCLVNERAALASLFETPAKLHDELQIASSSPTKGGQSWGDASYVFAKQRWVGLVVTPVALPVRRRAAAQTLQVPDEVLALVDAPRPNDLIKQVDRWRGLISSDRILLDPTNTNTIGVMADAGLRTRRRLVTTRLALRVKWFADKHGRLPDRLEEICDPSMPQIPTKWFEGKSFIYTASGRSFTIDWVGLSPEVPRPTSSSNDEWRRVYGLLIKMDLIECTPTVKRE